MDPYSGIASHDDENESFINQPSYTIGSGSAYDDDDDNINKAMKAEPSAPFAYSSAPDPTILSSAAGGDLPEFEKLGVVQGNAYNDNDNVDKDDVDSEDEGFGHSIYGQRMDYSNAEYQDKFFMFLWILHFIVMFIVLIYQWSNTKLILKEANAGFLIVFLCAVIGAVLGAIWIKIIRKYSGKIIKIMLYGNLLFLFVTAFIHFLTFQMLSAIIYLVFAVFFGLYIWSIAKRIPFTAMLIDIACLIINQFPSVVVVSLGILILQIIWILWWSAIAVAYISQYEWNHFVVVLLLISFYWNLETFKNIGHTTVCGVAGTWFFTQVITHEPTRRSLKRAMTTSLGSIAFGSLVVAIISVLRQIVIAMKKRTKHNLVMCLLQCMLTCLQRAMEWFNMYAFVHVAVYGTAYVESAKNSWTLLKTKGFDALINDDLTGFVILCGALIGGIICAIIGNVMGKIGTETPETYGIFGFMVGFYLVLTVLQTVTSCVKTLFVCYAESPHALSVNHPAQYNRIEKSRKSLGYLDCNEKDDQVTLPSV